ncbi:MAG: phage tail protein I [Lentisphaeria bacterium]|nr:phage tail protein I [Lentisphaeria bacterium]
MKTIANISLLDILPDSIASDENIRAIAAAINPYFQLLASQVDIPAVFVNIDDLPDGALNHLAVQFDVNPYRDTWDIELKRAAIKNNVANKRVNGTLYAIKKAVEILGATVSIIPWYDQVPLGTPGTFMLEVQYSGEAISSVEIQEDVKKAIDYAKPFSRHVEMVIKRGAESEISVFGIGRPLVVTRLTAAMARGVEAVDADGNVYDFDYITTDGTETGDVDAFELELK